MSAFGKFGNHYIDTSSIEYVTIEGPIADTDFAYNASTLASNVKMPVYALRSRIIVVLKSGHEIVFEENNAGYVEFKVFWKQFIISFCF